MFEQLLRKHSNSTLLWTDSLLVHSTMETVKKAGIFSQKLFQLPHGTNPSILFNYSMLPNCSTLSKTSMYSLPHMQTSSLQPRQHIERYMAEVVCSHSAPLGPPTIGVVN